MVFIWRSDFLLLVVIFLTQNNTVKHRHQNTQSKSCLLTVSPRWNEAATDERAGNEEACSTKGARLLFLNDQTIHQKSTFAGSKVHHSQATGVGRSFIHPLIPLDCDLPVVSRRLLSLSIVNLLDRLFTLSSPKRALQVALTCQGWPVALTTGLKSSASQI